MLLLSTPSGLLGTGVAMMITASGREAFWMAQREQGAMKGRIT